MRGLVFFFILTNACHAAYDDISYEEYWDSGNGGIIHDEDPNIIMYRTTVNNTASKTLTQENHVSSENQTGQSREKRMPQIDYDQVTERLETFDNVMLYHLTHNQTEEEARLCSDGRMKQFECHVCYCVGGQIYVCSSEKCPVLSNLNTKKLGSINSGKQTLAGYKYRGADCVEGQEMKTSTCNKCVCLGGQVYCHTNKCHLQPKSQILHDHIPRFNQEQQPASVCNDNQHIPSPDNCNKCVCRNGQVFCTNLFCGPIVQTEYRHCPPKKWHSLKEFGLCKECYCIDGLVSFCYLDYCSTIVATVDESEIQHGKVVHKKQLLVAPETCRVGQTVQLKCRTCQCTALNKWRCWNIPYNPSCRAPGPVQALCEPGKYFTLGTADTCQGCHCAMDRKWRCWSVKGACASFYDYQCPPGDLQKNSRSHCSMCYCGIDGTNMCTTDENCAHSVALERNNKQHCDSIVCLQRCVRRFKRNSGICLQTGCKCI